MACRIGISHEPAKRREQWERKHRIRNWKILAKCNSKTEAQAEETRLAKKYGCRAEPGGAGPERATWSVYYFEY